MDVDALPSDESPARRYNPPGIKIEQPVFFLKLSGKPLRLKSPKDPTAFPFMSVNMYVRGEGNGEVEGENTTMAYAAFRLSAILGHSVIDETGLTGANDFHLDAPDAKDADRTNATLEGIKTLGLKLKSGKAPIDAIIVDRVSQPTPN